jgi:branched-chain amino acid transport system permease protein
MSRITDKKNALRDNCMTLLALAAFALFLWQAPLRLDGYKIRIINLIAINAILGLSLNFIYGMGGMFSLGHAGFMAIGAYVSAIMILTPTQKTLMWLIDPITPWLLRVQTPFLASLFAAGLIAAIFGCLISFPVLRLGGDYLGIATLGFSEILRVLIMNLTPITNGSLGIKGIPAHTTLWMSYGILVILIFCTARLMNSNFGNVLKAVRDDEIAAKTMGIDTFRTKVLAFSIGCFGGGIGGALMGNLITTIGPTMFGISQTYSILMIVVIGGLGSMTGSIIGAILVTTMLEWLRFVEDPIMIGMTQIPLTGRPGMRMVIFSVLLIAVIIFRREGIMGMREFSWNWFFSLFNRAPKKVNVS